MEYHLLNCGLYTGSPSEYNTCTCGKEENKKVVCIACDKEFGSEHGMKIHFTIKHKDEII